MMKSDEQNVGPFTISTFRDIYVDWSCRNNRLVANFGFSWKTAELCQVQENEQNAIMIDMTFGKKWK